MSSPCVRQDNTIDVNWKILQEALKWALPASCFAGCKDGSHVSWKARILTYVAVLWCCSDESTLRKRFSSARKLGIKMFRWQDEPGDSYQGFLKALRRKTAKLFEIVLPCLRGLMQACDTCWEVAGWVLFGVDGSRVETPRTRKNEARFHPTKKRKNATRSRANKPAQTTKKARRQAKGASQQKPKPKPSKTSNTKSAKKKQSAGPQIWLTLFWHVGLGLPWAWKTGPVDSSERAHMQDMLDLLPENSMIVADPGFVGYDNWQAIEAAGHAFVVRVGANVKLLKKLGYTREYSNRVYLWPDKARKQSQPPMILRLIVVSTGKHPMYLVTNVLSKSALSDRQVAEIYKARWGIEVFFRSLKQTFNRRKLRSRTPDNALLELDWSLVALWLACLLAVNQLIRQGDSPRRVGVAQVLDAIRTAMRHYRWRPDPGEDLWSLLSNALIDDYERHRPKAARNYPRKKNEKPAGRPKLLKANREQISCAQAVKENQLQKQLTA